MKGGTSRGVPLLLAAQSQIQQQILRFAYPITRGATGPKVTLATKTCRSDKRAPLSMTIPIWWILHDATEVVPFRSYFRRGWARFRTFETTRAASAPR